MHPWFFRFNNKTRNIVQVLRAKLAENLISSPIRGPLLQDAQNDSRELHAACVLKRRLLQRAKHQRPDVQEDSARTVARGVSLRFVQIHNMLKTIWYQSDLDLKA